MKIASPIPLTFDGPQPSELTEFGTVLKQIGSYTFSVSFTGGRGEPIDRSHTALIGRDGEGYSGACNCIEFENENDACPHLWALRRAELHEVIQVADVAAAFDGGRDVCPMCGGSHEEAAGAL